MAKHKVLYTCQLCFTENEKSDSVLRTWRTLNRDSEEKGALVATCVGCGAPMLITVGSDGTVELVRIDESANLDDKASETVEIQQLEPPITEEQAYSMYKLGLKWFEEESYVNAYEHWRSAYGWYSTHAADAKLIASLLSNMGMAKSRLRRPDEALDYFQQALPLLDEREDTQFYATVLNNIGGAYLHLGDLDRAEEFHREAFEVHLVNQSEAALIHRERENLVFVYGRQAAVSAEKGNFQKAIGYEELSAALYRDIGDTKQLKFHWLKIGNLFRQLGHHEKASQDWEAALEAYQQSLQYHARADVDDLIRLEDLKSLSEGYRALGQMDECITTMQEIDEISRGLSARLGGQSLAGIRPKKLRKANNAVELLSKLFHRDAPET